ncbi:cytochrome P450 9e2-like [Andrena cerasifolii]|uniref:cytochrome P450 9e2-like n=1 Tax=Andrena cerasifolii TaxID=2819439 RepID=UPI004037DAC5
MTEYLQRAYNLYRYFGFYESDNPVIVIRDPELMTTIAVKHFDQFPGHRPLANEDLGSFMAQHLFGLCGDRCQEMRKLLTPSFTSSKMKIMFTPLSYKNTWRVNRTTAAGPRKRDVAGEPISVLQLAMDV